MKDLLLMRHLHLIINWECSIFNLVISFEIGSFGALCLPCSKDIDSSKYISNVEDERNTYLQRNLGKTVLKIANPEFCNKNFKNVITKPFTIAPEDYF